MNTITIYKDLGGTFVAYVDISGATTGQVEARLLLGLANRTLLFDGELIDNKVEIKYPKLSDIEETRAEVILEIIADGVYFRAYEAQADLELKRSVDVQGVEVEAEPIVVNVTNIETVETPSEERAAEEPEKEQATPKKQRLVRPEAAPRHKRFIQQSIVDYDELEKEEKRKLRLAVRTYEPAAKVQDWGESAFNDLEAFHARLCMYLLEQKMEENKEAS